MKLPTWAVALLAVVCSPATAEVNTTEPLSSHQILPSNFKPPQVFKIVDLVRNINLEKGYAKELINAVIQNTDTAPQQEYYLPFEAKLFGHVGGIEVRDKKSPEKGAFKVDAVEVDVTSPTQFYRVTLPEPLAPSAQQTLIMSYHLLSALQPLPAAIGQQDKQYLQFAFSTYSPAAYPTGKQKTKIKFPNASVPDYTGEPEKQGSAFTYGPYDNIPAGAESAATVRYEFTKPIIHVNRLERDIEVSHWGGNVAFEERYWLTNKAAALVNNFNRVTWAQQRSYNPKHFAIWDVKVPMKAGSMDPYFTDDIGNVSTSNFRSNARGALLELRPRYPMFGGWNFPFRIGWNANLKNFLRSVKGQGYVLNVPFLEGPKMDEGISYERIELRVILPEGATNVKYETSVGLVAEAISSHKTFMDTLGRPTVLLTAMNVIDDVRDQALIVTYDYPTFAGLRKPITIFAGVMAVFATAWFVGSIDVSIGKKKA